MALTRQELIQQITAERNAYADALANSLTIDELFERTMKTLSDEQLADYQHYCEKRAEFEKNFAQFSRQFVWGRDESQWPADPARRKELREYRSEQKNIQFTEFFDENANDERFVNGASLARFIEADKDLTLRAANMIREKQRAYENLNPIARFFSHLNPFSNKYRTMRNEIKRITVKTANITGCPKEKLDQYAAGKITDLEFTKRDGYEFDTLSNCVQTAIVKDAPIDLDDDFTVELGRAIEEPPVFVMNKREYTKEELETYEKLDEQYKDIPLADVKKELNEIMETRQNFFNLDSNVKNALEAKIQNDKTEHRQKMEELKPDYEKCERLENESKALDNDIKRYKERLETLKENHKGEADGKLIEICEDALKHAKEMNLTSKDCAKWAVENHEIYGKTLGDIDKIPKENTKQIENLTAFYNDIQTKISDYVLTSTSLEQAEKGKADLDSKIDELKEKKTEYIKETKIVKGLEEKAQIGRSPNIAGIGFNYLITSIAPDYDQKKQESDNLEKKSSELWLYTKIREEKETQRENALQSNSAENRELF